MAARKQHSAPEPPRPPCTTCGQPAVHRIELIVCPLHVDYDTTGRGTWTPSYRPTTSISSTVCQECLQKHVTITTSATATIVNGKRD